MSTGFASYPQFTYDEFVQKLTESVAQLPKQEAKLAQFMLLNLDVLPMETGRSLAERVGVPEVTIGRLLRRLGCEGMRELKVLARERYVVSGIGRVERAEVRTRWQSVLEAELAVVRNIFEQTSGQEWAKAGHILNSAERVFVTGFQSVRGIAEDFARRLLIARSAVQFLAAHDGMLAELIDDPFVAADRTAVVILDVVPYAAESNKLAKLAKEQGRACIVVSDEYCHWSREIADAVIYAPSSTGLFLESTTGLNLAAGLLVDMAAEARRDASQARMTQWKSSSRRLGLF